MTCSETVNGPITVLRMQHTGTERSVVPELCRRFRIQRQQRAWELVPGAEAARLKTLGAHRLI
jgi:hypothetical protein